MQPHWIALHMLHQIVDFEKSSFQFLQFFSNPPITLISFHIIGPIDSSRFFTKPNIEHPMLTIIDFVISQMTVKRLISHFLVNLLHHLG